MRVIGLTGGIGTGKSTVARLLAEKGARIIDADAVAREVVAPGSEGLQEIIHTFGPGVLDPQGNLDRARLGERVFADEAQRRALEAITHPRIFLRMGEKMNEAAEAGAPVVILDVPLLYEGGSLTGVVEKIIVVYAPAAVQERRVMSRDGLDAAAVRARMAAQMDIEEKRRRADYVIDNSGTPEATKSQVEALWAVLTANP